MPMKSQSLTKKLQKTDTKDQQEASPESLSSARNMDIEETPLGTQSLLRGLLIMEILSRFSNGCPLAKLVERSGMNKSTVHRLLQGLQSAGYVCAAPTPGSYRLTTKCVEVGQRALSSLNIIHVAARHLEALNLETGQTVNLSFREGDHAILIYKLESTEGFIRTRAYIGQHLEMYCSAMGKIFLAFDHPQRSDDYWKRNEKIIVPLTRFTIVDQKKMQAELKTIREKGYAIDREEYGLGMWCICAPIFNIENQIEYAVSIAVATASLNDERLAYLINSVQQTAKAISEELGGSRDLGNTK